MEEEEDMEGAERARKKKGHVCAERGNINHEKKGGKVIIFSLGRQPKKSGESSMEFCLSKQDLNLFEVEFCTFL